MEIVSVSKKLWSYADVGRNKLRQFVVGKLFVLTNVPTLYLVDINAIFNVIRIAVNKLINIIHVENCVKKSDQTVDILVGSIVIPAKSAHNFHVKLKFSLNVNVVIDKLHYSVECQKIKRARNK